MMPGTPKRGDTKNSSSAHKQTDQELSPLCLILPLLLLSFSSSLSSHFSYGIPIIFCYMLIRILYIFYSVCIVVPFLFILQLNAFSAKLGVMLI
jgi:hypothetical protein